MMVPCHGRRMGRCQRSHLTALEHIVVQRNLLQGFRCMPWAGDALEVLIDCVCAIGIGEGVWTAQRTRRVYCLPVLFTAGSEHDDTWMAQWMFLPQLCGRCCCKRHEHRIHTLISMCSHSLWGATAKSVLTMALTWWLLLLLRGRHLS